jgi:DUF4097 and DUF4098 domain-containing protein YvlB
MQEQTKAITLIETKPNLKFKLKSETIPIKIKGSDTNLVQMNFLSKENSSIPFEQIKDNVNYFYDEENNSFTLDIDDNDSIFNGISLNLKIPQKTEMKIISENSPIQIKFLEGFQQIQSENGPINAKEINGQIIISTENGPINLRKCDGNFDIKSENSPINIEESKGEIFKIETENGPIKLSKLSGNLFIKSENGSINIEESNGEKFNFKTENGGIKSKANSFLSGNIKCENGKILFDTSKTKEGDFLLESSNGKIVIIVNKDKKINLEAQTEYGALNIDLDGIITKTSNDGHKKIKVEQENAKINISAKSEYGAISTNEDEDFNFSFDSGNFKNHLNGYMKMLHNLIGNEHLKEFVNIFSAKDNKMKDKTKEKVSKIVIKVKDEIEKNLPNKKVIIDGKDISQVIKDKLDKVAEKLEKNENQQKTAEEPSQENDFSEARMKILQMLDEKKITVEQAVKLLDALK